MQANRSFSFANIAQTMGMDRNNSTHPYWMVTRIAAVFGVMGFMGTMVAIISIAA